ncbi:MAG: FxsA family protein [Candidatus Latescibacterota bacterium]|nr:FxsA family protein [Candidatus Latescibacterota bacterium]
MLFRLFVIFSVVPIIELALLIEIGNYIGSSLTITIIITTGLAGAVLARSQGLFVLKQLQLSIQNLQSPADPIIEGVLVLMGGLLLITPGILTDIIGFFTLFPFSRQLLRNIFKEIILKRMNKNMIYTNQYEEKI